jgi:predicted DNA repair protein MutK
MPVFLKVLAASGTAAMIWGGGGIITHGLAGYGFPAIGDAIHHGAVAAAQAVPPDFAGAVEWIVTAAGSGIVGLAIGAALIPLTSRVIMPLWNSLKSLRNRSVQ